MDMSVDENIRAMEQCEAGIPVSEKSPTKTTSSFGTKQSLLRSKQTHILNPAYYYKLREAAWKAWLGIADLLRCPTAEVDRQPFVRALEACPRGYPNLAAFLDSDENFMLYRRFGFIQARILLDKQDEMRILEEKLDRMDQRIKDSDPDSLQTRDIAEEDGRPRKELLKRIETKFCEYAKFLSAAQQLMSFNKPAPGDYKSVETYINNNKPLVEDEGSYIYRKEDLVTLRAGREHAWLDTWVEKFLRVINCKPIEYIFCSKETRDKSHGIEVYYTRERIEYFVAAIITFIILAQLVVPIYILDKLSNTLHSDKLVAIHVGILLVFTLVFSAILSMFTRAKRHEILAASAA